jgi:hypothetical protein
MASNPTDFINKPHELQASDSQIAGSNTFTSSPPQYFVPVSGQPSPYFAQVYNGVPNQTVEITPNPFIILGLGIFTCLFCFWPLGLGALIFSCVAISKKDNDTASAASHNKTSLYCSLASVVIGVILIVVLIILLLAK